MATKLYDVCVKTGSYTNNQGEQKNRYENIGTVMQGDDGGQFMLLKTTFNPAGVPNPDNKDAVLCSMFEPQQQGQQQGHAQQPQQAPQQYAQQPYTGQPQQAPQNNSYAATQNGAPQGNFNQPQR